MNVVLGFGSTINGFLLKKNIEVVVAVNTQIIDMAFYQTSWPNEVFSITSVFGTTKGKFSFEM
jgi:hypothetical protein